MLERKFHEKHFKENRKESIDSILANQKTLKESYKSHREEYITV